MERPGSGAAPCACLGNSEDSLLQVEPTVFDPLTSTLERAKGVQQTLDESVTARRRALEQAE